MRTLDAERVASEMLDAENDVISCVTDPARVPRHIESIVNVFLDVMRSRIRESSKAKRERGGK